MNWGLLWKSLGVAVPATCLALAFGVLAAMWLLTLPARWRGVLLGLAIGAVALPPFLVANCWLQLAGSNGLLQPWLPGDIYSIPGTVWVLSLLWWPIPLLLVLGTWHQMDARLLEVEPALRGWACIRRLLWPHAKWPLFQSGVVVFALTINNMSVPAILRTTVYPLEIWINFNTTYDFGRGFQASLPLLLIPVAVLAVFRGRSIAWPRRSDAVSPRLFRRQIGKLWCGVSGSVGCLIALVSVVLPIVQILVTSRTWTELDPAMSVGGGAIRHSLIYAGGGATLCLGLGLLLRPVRYGSLLWLGFLLPGMVIGMVAMYIFNRPWLAAIYDSVAIVLIAYMLRYGALSWQGAAYAFRGMDPVWSEVARLNGVGWWGRIRHVYWPQVGRPMLVLWYITYLLCLWDVETMILIVPPGGETLAQRVFNLLHYGHIVQVNAFCLMMLGLAVLPLAIWGLGCGVGHWCRRHGARRRAEAVASAVGSGGHGFGRRLGAWLGGGLVGVALLAGCSPPAGNEAGAMRTALGESRLFREARVIGDRGTGAGHFSKPRSLAIDDKRRLYVSDMTGRIQQFSLDGEFLASWQMPEIRKGRPKGMGWDSRGRVIVVEPHYNRVNFFNPTGERVAQWGGKDKEGGMRLPRAVAENGSEELYIAEYGEAHQVRRYALATGELIGRFGSQGSGPGEFSRPEGLAIDREGRVYVADSCNHRVQVFSADGAFLWAFGKPGAAPGAMSYPYDVAIDSEGRRYVCEFGNSRIQVFGPGRGGELIEVLGGSGSTPGELHNPWAIALDRMGNLYVADAENHRVQKFIRR